MESQLSGTLDSEDWGEKIRAFRHEEDWSQSDLADRLGVRAQTVSDLERGRKRLTLERLNRILEALGYKATINLEKFDDPTLADWGPISAEEPSLRGRIRRARELAEDLANFLYEEYDVEAVYCFGSLVEDGGTRFGEHSDVDLLVGGLEAPKLFEAQSRLDLDIAESDSAYSDLSFDVVRAESFREDSDTLLDRGNALFLPQDKA